jgi:hypothetical protein
MSSMRSKKSNPDHDDSDRLTFVTVVHPNSYSEENATLLIRSIREFAGRLASPRILSMICFDGGNEPTQTRARLEELGSDTLCCELGPEELEFPFIAEARCASEAEKAVSGNTEVLAWLLPNTIVLNEPIDFMLGEEMELAYRPVHHRLLGSAVEEPLDFFWTSIYNVCGVGEEQVFAMVPHVEEREIRPYFNAGILVYRPTTRLLSRCDDLFESVYLKPEFMRFYETDSRYRIFMHQAVLTGVILKTIRRANMLELPDTYNYPVYLHDEDRTPCRPDLVDNLITVRHEGFHRNPDWASRFPAGNGLKRWIAGVLSTF